MRTRERNLVAPLALAAGIVVGCEDGPKDVFTTKSGDPAAQNGFAPGRPWTPAGKKGFDEEGGGDSAGRALFCDEAETTAVIQAMVGAPIVPDVSAGKVPLRAPDGGPLRADELVGRPEDGKFCDPTGVYLNAFTWGPTNEIVVFFDQDTRLVEGVQVSDQYLGTLDGEYTDARGEKVRVTIKPRERVRIGDRELDEYTSRADQQNRPNAWLNHQNVTAIYAMVRETFFGAAPLPNGFDCVEAKLCDLIYTSGSESTPQQTLISFVDSGTFLVFSPEGQVPAIYLEPVRVAPFELEARLRFGQTGSSTMAFSFASVRKPACVLGLDDALTWTDFVARCIDVGDERTLARVNYAVEPGRDAVQAEFNGVQLGFLRATSERGIFEDGERPGADDRLYSIAFTRSLEAPVEEFRPRDLAVRYGTLLQARLLAAIDPRGPTPPEQHPLALYRVSSPFIRNAPARIGELKTPNDTSWIPQVIESVLAEYASLTPEEQAQVDPRLVDDPTYLVEPFVDAVLQLFSHGESERPGAFKAFRTTDDRRWSIGFAHWRRGGVAYRLEVQYSLNFGAITAVLVERGESEVDAIFQAIAETQRVPYYQLSLARETGAYDLGKNSIEVMSFDRRLETLDVRLLRPGQEPLALSVSGLPRGDKNGYQKQLRGERFEFVPADEVRLYGKETSLVFHVGADGLIGRIEQQRFKGALELCPGLSVRYGDDVAAAVARWSAREGLDAHRDCDLVFNYSTNGRVLKSVASLSRRRLFTVIDGRAVTAALWR